MKIQMVKSKRLEARSLIMVLITSCLLLLTSNLHAEMDRDSTTIPELNAKTNLDSTDMFIIAQAVDSANYKVLFDRIVDSVEDSIRGNVVNAWIKSGAAIAIDKLATGTTAYIIVNNGSGVPTYVAMSGDATISNAGAVTIAGNAIGTAEITDGSIVNADINAGAAIVYSKLVLTNSVVSGDITDETITSSDILNGTIASADILDGTIVSADITDGTITGSDIASGTVTSTNILDATIAGADILDGTIANVDINAGAQIEATKLETALNGQIIISTTPGVPDWQTISGDITLSNLGVVDIADSLGDDFKLTGNITYTNSQTFTPTDVVVEAGSGGLAVGDYSKIIKMSATAGAATILDISGGTDGQEIILHNSSASTYDVTIDDGTEFQIHGGTDRVLSTGDSIHLWYDADVDIWYEIGGNN